jgi:hypothetical protein
MTNIELSAMHAIVALPKIAGEIAAQLRRIADALEGAENGKNHASGRIPGENGEEKKWS